MRLLAPFHRKATSASELHTVTMAGLPQGFQFTPDQPRPSLHQVMQRYGRWVWLCTGINARVAASVRPRLFTIGGSSEVLKCQRFNPKPLDARTKAYLKGNGTLKASPLAMRKMQGNVDDMTEVLDHEVLTLLDNVNPWDEGFSYRESIYVDLQLAGRHFTLIIGEETPLELWRIMPQYVTALPHQRDFVAGFQYQRGSVKKIYKPDEVFWIKQFDPYDPWGGVGWVEAWLKTIDSDYSIIDFTDWMFKRGGMPDVIVTSPGEVSEPNKRAFRLDWRRLFGKQSNRAESVAFVSGKEVKIETFAHTPKDLEYSQGRAVIRDEICAASGVPKSYLTTDDVNRATAAEGNPNHIRVTVWPMVSRVEEAINQRLLPKWSDRLVLVHENPIKEDSTIRIQDRASKLASGWSVNEIRNEDGVESLDDEQADVPMVSSAIVPLSMAGQSMTPFGMEGEPGADKPATAGEEVEQVAEASPQAGAIETLEDTVLNGAQVTAATAIVVAVAAGQVPRDSGIGQLEVLFNLTTEQAERIMGTAGTSTPTTPNPNPKEEAEREADAERMDAQASARQSAAPDKHWHGDCKQSALWATKDDRNRNKPQAGVPDNGMKGFAAEMERVFNGQASAVIAALERFTMAEVEALLRSPEWQEQVKAAAEPFVGRAALKGGRMGLGRLNDIPDGIRFDFSNPAVQQFVEQYTVRLAESVNGSTRVALEKLLGEGLAQGETIPELAARVREYDSTVSGARAEMIARTESARAYVSGQEEAWKQTGVVVGKRWLLAPDACSYCQAAAAEYATKTVPLGTPFYAQGSVLVDKNGGRMELDYMDVDGAPLHVNCRCDVVPVLEGE